MRILVAIPTLDEEHTIAQVIDRLSQDIPEEFDVRFVIADGGSTDRTRDVVSAIGERRRDVDLLANPGRLQSVAVNLVVALFGGDRDVLVRCDAHAGYPLGYIRRLVETMQRTGADSVVVPMDSVGGSCVQKAVAWVSDTPLGSGGSVHRGGRRSGFVDHGHHALIRIDAFRRVHGYDESFSHNEDAEFDCRFRALGGTIYLDGETRLDYHPRTTLAALWRQYSGYGQGRSRTVTRHPRSLRLRQLAVPAFILACCAAIVASPLAPILLSLPAFYGLALACASFSVALTQRAVCGLLAGPAALTMHVGWAFGFLKGMLLLREKPWRPGDAIPRGLKPSIAAS